MIRVSEKTKKILVPITSVIAGFLVGAIIMMIWSYNPIQAYSSMFESALGNMNGIGETIREATPLIFTAIGFHCFNCWLFTLDCRTSSSWLTDFHLDSASNPHIAEK